MTLSLHARPPASLWAQQGALSYAAFCSVKVFEKKILPSHLRGLPVPLEVGPDAARGRDSRSSSLTAAPLDCTAMAPSDS